MLVGDFTCMDEQGNIILTSTYEHMTLNGQCVAGRLLRLQQRGSPSRG